MPNKRSILYCFVLVTSLAVNVFQARQLGIAGGIFGRSENTSTNEALPDGTQVHDLEVRNLGGTPQTIRFSDYPGRTVLYVISPSCFWCAQNAASIAYLSHHATGSRFIAISMGAEGVPQFVERTALPFPIFKDPVAKAVDELRMGVTPTTIVVSSQGKVIKSWQGAFQAEIREDVGRFFAVSLPKDL